MGIIPRRVSILCTVNLSTRGGRWQGLRIKGRFRKATRRYSGLLRAAPGTERYRLTDRHRRFNRDMNSASVWLFSTRETGRERRGGERKRKTNRSIACYYFCPLRCWCTALCPEVRNTVHMPVSHWNCLCAWDRRLLVRWPGRCCVSTAHQIKCMVLRNKACLQAFSFFFLAISCWVWEQ